VEHPVSELITGLDLVKEQIRIAAGEKILFSQEELKINGHAIELRVCAEDPANNFLPNIGRIESYSIPKGPGVRVDDCMEAGMEIPIYYDNMIAKLVVWGQDREQAIQRMLRAIPEFRISGIETTLAFGAFVLRHPNFVNGDFDTHFIEKYFKPQDLERTFNTGESQALSMAAAAFYSENGSERVLPGKSAGGSEWLRKRKH
jgi:acetyl/propionyl-CoA carboxylase alpha subunit